MTADHDSVRATFVVLLVSILCCGCAAAPLDEPITFTSANTRMVVDAGGIRSLKRVGSDAELIRAGSELYALRLRGASDLSSGSAESVTVRRPRPGEAVLTFSHLGGEKVRLTIAAGPRSPFILMRLAFYSPQPRPIQYLSFPVLSIPVRRGAAAKRQTFISSKANGLLTEGPPARFHDSALYPGPASMQLVGCYDDKAGIYLAAHDTAGHVKRLVSDRRGGNFRLYQGWASPLTACKGWTDVPYPAAVSTFTGDWRSAAELYRSWAEKQPWCKRKWAEKTEMPQWLKDSPLFENYRLLVRKDQTVRDKAGRIIEAKTPPRVAADLKALRAKMGVAVVGRFNGWEKHGNWVGADCLPPNLGWAGHDDLLRRARADGNLGAVLTSGYWWPYVWNQGPGGDTTFNHKDELVRRYGDVLAVNADGSWVERGHRGWCVYAGLVRSAKLCRGTAKGQKHQIDIGLAFIDRGWPMLHIDQENSVGAGKSFCASSKHGHPPGFGPWLWKAMADVLNTWRAAAAKKGYKLALSIEEPAELLIPHMDSYQARNFQTWIKYGTYTRHIPLFNYVYHEYLPGFASAVMWAGHDDFRLHEVAAAVTSGVIPGVAYDRLYVMKSTKLLRVSDYLAQWCQARAGFAKDYLAFGRAVGTLELNVPVDERPLAKAWNEFWKDGRKFREPLVHNSTWTTPAGKWGCVIAGGVDRPVACKVAAAGLPKAAAYELVTLKGDQRLRPAAGAVTFTVQPATVYLLRAVQ